MWLFGCLLGLLAASCSDLPDDLLVVAPPDFGAGTASLEVTFGSEVDAETLEIVLDGSPITDRFALAAGVARGVVEVGEGDHELLTRARLLGSDSVVSHRLVFAPPPGLPRLLQSDPAPGAADFPRGEWIRLAFAAPTAADAIGSVELSCNGAAVPRRVYRPEPSRLLVDPHADLPAAAACELRWRGRRGSERLAFATAPTGAPALVLYDRTDPRRVAPFPDDYWLATNPADPSEQRLRVGMSGLGLPDQWLFNALTSAVRQFDGFSPIGHITIPLSAAPDPDSLPHTSLESLAPLASVLLFDVTPGDPAHGARVPFRLEALSEATNGRTEHALLLFPSISLQAGHRYGVVVTRRVRVDAGRPFEPSPFFRKVRDRPADPDESWSAARVRALVAEVLAVAGSAEPPIHAADVAFAARFTIRSTEGISRDLLEIRRATLAGPPPEIAITQVELESLAEIASGSRVAAIVHGTWQAPEWRTRRRQLARHPTTRVPVQTGVRAVPFVLALPRAALRGPVPVVMYQHGNPGSAEHEVIQSARRSLAAAGFAVAGFTDVINREVVPPGPSDEVRAHRQIVEILLRVLATSAIPYHFVQTVAEQLSFVRALGAIAAIPRFRVDSPRAGEAAAIFGIDPSQPLAYLGISEGAHHGSMLLPFAPEIRAAVLVSPGRRFSEILVHQKSERLLAPLAFLGFGQLRPTDIWVLLALLQSIFDDQDPHNFAPFLYRDPLDIEPARRASVLVVEGLGDSLVPNHATRALARALGPIPQLAAPGHEIPGFQILRGAVAGNVDARTTAAYYQYVPQGVPGVDPTPGCVSPPMSAHSAGEGHYCAQSAAESLRQRVRFFESALRDGAPEIIDPLTR